MILICQKRIHIQLLANYSERSNAENVSRTIKNKCSPSMCTTTLEAEFLDEIQTKVFKVFLLTIHRHLYSFALRFLFLQIHATSYYFYSKITCTVKDPGVKPLPPPPPYVLRNPYRNLKSENSQKPQRNCTFMNSVFVIVRPTVPVSAKPSKTHPYTVFPAPISISG